MATMGGHGDNQQDDDDAPRRPSLVRRRQQRRAAGRPSSHTTSTTIPSSSLPPSPSRKSLAPTTTPAPAVLSIVVLAAAASVGNAMPSPHECSLKEPQYCECKPFSVGCTAKGTKCQIGTPNCFSAPPNVPSYDQRPGMGGMIPVDRNPPPPSSGNPGLAPGTTPPGSGTGGDGPLGVPGGSPGTNPSPSQPSQPSIPGASSSPPLPSGPGGSPPPPQGANPLPGTPSNSLPPLSTSTTTLLNPSSSTSPFPPPPPPGSVIEGQGNDDGAPILAIALGVSAAVLVLAAILAYVLIRRRRAAGAKLNKAGTTRGLPTDEMIQVSPGGGPPGFASGGSAAPGTFNNLSGATTASKFALPGTAAAAAGNTSAAAATAGLGAGALAAGAGAAGLATSHSLHAAHAGDGPTGTRASGLQPDNPFTLDRPAPAGVAPVAGPSSSSAGAFNGPVMELVSSSSVPAAAGLGAVGAAGVAGAAAASRHGQDSSRSISPATDVKDPSPAHAPSTRELNNNSNPFTDQKPPRIPVPAAAAAATTTTTSKSGPDVKGVVGAAAGAVAALAAAKKRQSDETDTTTGSSIHKRNSTINPFADPTSQTHHQHAVVADWQDDDEDLTDLDAASRANRHSRLFNLQSSMDRNKPRSATIDSTDSITYQQVYGAPSITTQSSAPSIYGTPSASLSSFALAPSSQDGSDPGVFAHSTTAHLQNAAEAAIRATTPMVQYAGHTPEAEMDYFHPQHYHSAAAAARSPSGTTISENFMTPSSTLVVAPAAAALLSPSSDRVFTTLSTTPTGALRTTVDEVVTIVDEHSGQVLDKKTVTVTEYKGDKEALMAQSAVVEVAGSGGGDSGHQQVEYGLEVVHRDPGLHRSVSVTSLGRGSARVVKHSDDEGSLNVKHPLTLVNEDDENEGDEDHSTTTETITMVPTTPSPPAQEDTPIDLSAYHPPAPTSHVALHSYTPSNPDELRLSPGDLIGLEQSYEDGWARGQNITLGRQRGYFPMCRLVPIRSGPSQTVLPASGGGRRGTWLDMQTRNSIVGGDKDEQPIVSTRPPPRTVSMTRGRSESTSSFIPGPPSRLEQPAWSASQLRSVNNTTSPPMSTSTPATTQEPPTTLTHSPSTGSNTSSTSTGSSNGSMVKVTRRISRVANGDGTVTRRFYTAISLFWGWDEDITDTDTAYYHHRTADYRRRIWV
ncbi:hypothetical protein DFS34DRAFT_611225 [Phlyctochytrium arcticum]|nr:hypothetical protein DFS34DRAFT_611225 [Phlyctochytrium arcticum]